MQSGSIVVYLKPCFLQSVDVARKEAVGDRLMGV